MSSPLTSLYYQKINDTSCLIIQREESLHGDPNGDLDFSSSKGDAMITGLHFLCELMEKNNIDCELLELVRRDLQLSPDQTISQKYMNYDVVQKCVQDIEIIRYNTTECYLTDLPISEEDREKLKSDIMRANVPYSTNALEVDLYTIYEDLDDNPVFDIKTMRNLARLEKYMTWEQIMDMRPGYTFKLMLRDNYLKNIKNMTRVESTLDTWICNWLDKE